jgi:ATP-dependent helicase/nuclease subunit B
MSYSRIFTGPTLRFLESKAFETLADTVGSQPKSILYVGQREHPRDVTRERWQTHGPSACLRIDIFDEVVSDCYERDQYKGRVTHVDRPLLFRLVELGVENIESPTNPFDTNGKLPRAGLVDAAEDLYTNLEFAGLLSPEEIRSRLVEEDLGRSLPRHHYFPSSFESGSLGSPNHQCRTHARYSPQEDGLRVIRTGHPDSLKSQSASRHPHSGEIQI